MVLSYTPMKKLLPILLMLTGYFVSGQVSRPTSSATTQHWDEVEPMVNGFSRVLQKESFTFINTAGHAIAPAKFSGARNFSAHRAAVQQNEKWGFINEMGIQVVPCVYDLVFDFKGLNTVVMKNGQWFLMGHAGNGVKNLDIDLCHGFENGVAIVEKSGRKGLLSLDGNIGSWSNAATAAAQRNTAVQSVANATTSNCPNNLDFENGNFTNWRCFTGSVDSIGNTNVITVNPSAPTANRHRIVTRANPSAIDPFGLFPTNPPDGSNFCVKLGNTNIGAQAERIAYTIRVPQNDSNFSVKYDYAVVFQDPGHTAWSQPRFTARLFDSASNTYVSCASFEYISTSSLPGFARSTVDTTVIFKSWASAFISLRQYAGKTMYLEFTTADCVRRGHWGYAYVDVEPSCGQSMNATYNCAYPNITTLDAPPGFQAYNWWSANYGSVLANGQHAVLNPGPASNTSMWLEMIPYNSFGCRDTLPVVLTTTYQPSFQVSETNATCAPHTITFYNNDIPSSHVNWNFGDGTTATGDTVVHTYITPGTFIVTMTATLPAGCSGAASDTITLTAASGSLQYVGGNFCDHTNVSFSVTDNGATAYHWNFGDGATQTTTTGAVTHTYATPGSYLPSVVLDYNSGCQLSLPGSDSIRIEKLNPEFIFNIQHVCDATTVSFNSQSTSHFGIASYFWRFGDGTTATGINPIHVYNRSGNFLVKLIITGVNGCMDSVSHSVPVSIWNTPVATIAGLSSICQRESATFIAGVRSADSIVSMQWHTSNNLSASGDSATFLFNQADTITINFIATTINGCADSAFKTIIVKPLPVIAQPADQQLCNGSSTTAVVLSSSLSATSFSWVNDNAGIGLGVAGNGNVPSFVAGNDTSYTLYANITVNAVSHGCAADPVSFTYIVFPTPQTIQPANQTVCDRGHTDPVIVNSFTSAVAANTYEWTNNLPSIGLAANGTGNIPSFTAINNTTQTQVATITLMARDNGCNGLPVQFTITVNPTPQMNMPASVQICNGATTAAINFNGTTGADLYNWTNSDSTIGLNGSGTGIIRPFVAVNNTNTPITANISVYPVLHGCNGVLQYFNIVVNPTPAVAQPADQRVCNGNATNAIAFQGTVLNADYNWTNNQPSIGLAASGSGNIPAFNPINNGLNAISANISVTPVINGCPGAPQVFVLEVMPQPDMLQPFNQFICNGQQTPFINFTGMLNNTTFSWVNDNSAIGLGASGNGAITSFVALNNSNTAQTATITVTPMASGCSGLPLSFIVHVDPTPDMVQPANQTVCSGVRIDSLLFSGTVAGTSFSWINSETEIGLPASGSGNMPSFVAQNPQHMPITAIINVVGLANSCSSLNRVFTITVNPSPVVDSIPNQSVCNGMQMNGIAVTSPVTGTQLRWVNDQPSIGLTASGTGDIPAFTAINNSASLMLANINVYGESPDQCQMAVQTFKIAVNPSPRVVAGNDFSMCRGSQMGMVVSGAASFQWSPSTGLNCSSCANPVTTATDNIDYVVEGTSAFGCKGYDTVRVNVIQPFQMLVSPNDTLCSGRTVQLNARNADRYEWSPSIGLNSTSIANPVATPTVSTRYRVIGFDAAHCFTDTGYVDIMVASSPSVNAGPDINEATGTQVVLQPTVNNGTVSTWSWSPAHHLSCDDCPHPILTVSTDASYVLTVVNRYGCKASDTLNVVTFCKNAQVFIPNAFTPDGDGANDIMMIRGTGISVKSFRIFNRWGNLVFEKTGFAPNDPKFGWDGKVRGIAAAPDVYVYIAEVVCDNGTPYMYKGNVTIIK